MSLDWERRDVVTPHKIGLQHTQFPALVLVYTTASFTKCRKRIMPLRSLGKLGAAACTRKMVEAHRSWLEHVAIDQIEALVGEILGGNEPNLDNEAAPIIVHSATDDQLISSQSEVEETLSQAETGEAAQSDSEVESSHHASCDCGLSQSPDGVAAGAQANVTRLQACLDKALIDLEHSDECGSPDSVLSIRPLSASLLAPPRLIW